MNFKCFATNTHRKDSDLISTISQGLWYTSSSSPDIIMTTLKRHGFGRKFPKLEAILFPICRYFYDIVLSTHKKNEKRKERRKRQVGKRKERKIKVLKSNNIWFNFCPAYKRLRLYHPLEYNLFQLWGHKFISHPPSKLLL